MDPDRIRRDVARFLNFAKASIRMNNDIDKVVATDEIVTSPTRADRATTAKRLSDYSGIKFFTIGPVYITASIPFDIVEDYKVRLKYTGPRLLLNFNHSIVDGIGSWCNLLEGVGAQAFDTLTRFVITQSAIRRATKELWGAVYQDVTIIDPCAVDNNAVTPIGGTATIRVFLPCGNKYRLTVAKAGSSIVLKREPPLLTRIKEAKIALNPALK